MLEKIRSYEDIKKLSIPELYLLARDVREEILKVVSRNGGHLAPPLGAVEIIISLLYVFDPKKDIIVFDVGHQAYAWKLLTDRKNYFETLKTWGGLGGYLRRDESRYDFFGAGHAGTSISAALGMAEAIRKKKENGGRKVIAVFGDGGITAGMAYEALNNLGELKTDFIAILNDNGMSISPNRGAIAEYLSKKLVSPFFWKMREKVKSIIRDLTAEKSTRIMEIVRRIEEAFMSLITPGILFEGLGLYYFGPIDGHKIEDLIEVFSKAKGWKGPVFIHTKTIKGKGYPPAEKDPEKYHGVSPFIIETGEPKKKAEKSTFSQVFGEFLTKLAEKDERIVAITAAMATGTGLDIFQKRFPQRFYDVGIAEQHAVTFSAGLAIEGLRPVAAIYSTFLQRAYDQLIHDVGIQNIPIVLCLDRAGIVGEDGPTHHGVFDIAYLRIIPNFVLMAPANENELKSMLITAINIQRPVAIRYPKGTIFGVKEEEPKEIEIGKGILMKDGKDVVIFAYGVTAMYALEAAREIEEEGISVAVVNARFAKPLDEEIILDYSSTNKKVITVEDGVIAGGFGSAVLELLSQKKLKVDIINLGVADVFQEHGKREDLLALIGIDKEGIKRAIISLF